MFLLSTVTDNLKLGQNASTNHWEQPWIFKPLESKTNCDLIFTLLPALGTRGMPKCSFHLQLRLTHCITWVLLVSCCHFGLGFTTLIRKPLLLKGFVSKCDRLTFSLEKDITVSAYTGTGTARTSFPFFFHFLLPCLHAESGSTTIDVSSV